MNLDETIKYYKKQAERDRILIESAECSYFSKQRLHISRLWIQWTVIQNDD